MFPHTGYVRRARLCGRLVADIALLLDPYRWLWIIEGNSDLAARKGFELVVMILQATKLESIAMQKGAGRAMNT